MLENSLIKNDRAWIELNFNNLKHNIFEFKRIIPSNTEIMAVVKANAYGHGIVEISTFLNSIGIDNFAVATLEEGIILRENNINGNILILGYTDIQNIEYVIKYDLIQTIVDYDYAKKISSLHLSNKLKCHIKINTGLNRIGENYKNIDNFLEIFKIENLNILGCFTHLAVADSLDEDDVTFTENQIENFYACINLIKSHGYDTGKLHIQNTYGTLNYPELNCDYVRLGIGMYGIYNANNHINNSNADVDLKPVLQLKAKISSVHELLKNDFVSYGRTFSSAKNMKIATVCIGYADGYPRNLSNKDVVVLINNHYSKIIGRICMDQLVIDVTDIPNVKCGDIVTLIGEDSAICAENISIKSDSITNELLCRLGDRLPRILI